MRTNWAGNVIFTAPDPRTAGTVAEVQSIVAAARQVRVLGSGHSFNDLADSAAVQLSLQGMNRVLSIDPDRRRVTVQGGIRYGELAPVLHAEGWALKNLASLPHISVAGAVATATHGSGSRIGNLATAVTGLEIVTAGGEVASLSRDQDGDRFAGAVVSLGALGVVTALTLEIEPTYQVRQNVYTSLPFAVIEGDFDAVFDAGTSVSVFTDWRGAAAHSVWVKDRVADHEAASRPDFHGALPATRKMHPLLGVDGADCTDQMGIPGPWHERLPHFRMGFTPSNGAEIQTEYFVPRAAAPEAVAIMRRHGDRLAPILMTSELRSVAADDLWLSPGNRGPYVGLHFTFRRDSAAVRTVLPPIEADLGSLGAVPHWGKVTTMSPATIRSRTPRLAAFRDLAQSFDPEGKFRNAYLRRLFDEA
ncbi:FAD-binding protein [Rhodobacter sp. SY28-1]|uniref:FAD-binding protein n=1 Tax=Rhodobacter sp. SY28-1 TaxID=2562317 RepID=UPI001F103E67|nr:FAD-binding protein [Rhodobacter sp. SY28-1]